MNYLSRKFEYEADDYAKHTFAAMPLISSLKKLSKNSLSNLTPHPAYVFYALFTPPSYRQNTEFKGIVFVVYSIRLCYF